MENPSMFKKKLQSLSFKEEVLYQRITSTENYKAKDLYGLFANLLVLLIRSRKVIL